MFNTVIKELLKPERKQIPDRVLALEMLTYNFHDVIALGPLFKQLERDIAEDSEMKQQPEKQRELRDRLQKVAWEVVYKQLAALGKEGKFSLQDVSFKDLENSPYGGIMIIKSIKEVRLTTGEDADDEQERRIIIRILKKDDDSKQIQVLLEAHPPGKPDRDMEISNPFWVSFSDFPLIDNIRLKDGNRVAVVLRRWEENSAEIGVAYFPGERASLKDKVYYEEAVEQILAERKP